MAEAQAVAHELQAGTETLLVKAAPHRQRYDLGSISHLLRWKAPVAPLQQMPDCLPLRFVKWTQSSGWPVWAAEDCSKR